ncbi:hypothetical protein PC1_2527 [Pectobacterium carotovorum subsp. carotovorum PC1]|jgi:hypothetical protein|uniref:Uncharacterized protein n=1 Tax=Pectobacterium carotovorum subsp. carotovorum (strain PC1) TaxID=561230 RepID=C6DKV7_PECCP|nr:hypothetical protein PC1_2527 [Pectobacterium carotovorum subsp. carotovorum PC1]
MTFFLLPACAEVCYRAPYLVRPIRPYRHEYGLMRMSTYILFMFLTRAYKLSVQKCVFFVMKKSIGAICIY